MQKIIQAAFPSVDAAEYAASYLQQHIPHVAQVSVTPRNQIGRASCRERV